MAEAPTPSRSFMPHITIPAWARKLTAYSSLIVPIGLIMLLGVLIVPMSPVVMDIMIASNLAMAAIVLLTVMYIEHPLEFSVFPALLLGTTLFRLVLNVASTRLILSADAQTPEGAMLVAGQVIEAFGQFVTGGSLVVGSIIFIIMIIIQFVVITKGATRVAEVAARFTLDGMPGKQMAIDADLNAGLIDENEARRRRELIADEADFYGAMDGASKFVRGDTIAGLIITVVNIIGGFAVGMLYKGWPVAETAEVFTKLTIGDGLVSQLPSFIISIAAGLIVTRSGTKRDLGTELTAQLTGRPVALALTSGFLATLSFTGLPMLPLLTLSGVVGGLAYYNWQKAKHLEVEHAQEVRQEEAAKEEGPPPVEKLMAVDTMELEVGYALVRMVDKSQGGDLLDRISMLRRQLAVDLGLVVPPVRIRDNMQLQPYEYHIKIRGNSIASGAVYPGQFLAMDSGLAGGPINGQHTKEPAFGLDAWWIEPAQRQRAETLNYTVVDATSVLATHLTEVIKSHAEELLTRDETSNLIEQLKQKAPKLVEEVIPDQIRTGELQKILQNLLRERVPIRDMETILETLSDWATRTKDLDVLTEYVRNALRRTICTQYVEPDPETSAGRLYCITLDPGLEDLVNGYIERSPQGTSMAMPPQVASRVSTAIVTDLHKLITAGHHPLILTSPQVRSQVRQLIESHVPNVAVLGYNEVSRGVEVEAVGMVQVDLAGRGQAPGQ